MKPEEEFEFIFGKDPGGFNNKGMEKVILVIALILLFIIGSFLVVYLF